MYIKSNIKNCIQIRTVSRTVFFIPAVPDPAFLCKSIMTEKEEKK